jgi:hypothetical protein
MTANWGIVITWRSEQFLLLPVPEPRSKGKVPLLPLRNVEYNSTLDCAFNFVFAKLSLKCVCGTRHKFNLTWLRQVLHGPENKKQLWSEPHYRNSGLWLDVLYYQAIGCDYRWVSEWWLDLLHSVDTPHEYTLQFTITYWIRPHPQSYSLSLRRQTPTE